MSRSDLYTAVTSALVALVNTVVMQLIRFWHGFEAMLAYGVALLMVCCVIILHVFRKTKKQGGLQCPRNR